MFIELKKWLVLIQFYILYFIWLISGYFGVGKHDSRDHRGQDRDYRVGDDEYVQICPTRE
tara:strand:+ start:236 stop:415 length:180 start_codon:yes stop_codon:yes gene_type:complete